MSCRATTHPVRRPDRLAGLAGLAAVLVGSALALPFARTGTAVRDGYGLAGTLRASGLAAGGPARLAAGAVAIVPALVASALVLAALGRNRRAAAAVAALLAAAAGLVGLVAGLAALALPALHPQAGACLAVATGGLAVVGCAVAPLATLRPAPVHEKGDPFHGCAQ